MEMTGVGDVLLQDDVRTLLKLVLVSLFALWVGIRYYRVLRDAERDAELDTLVAAQPRKARTRAPAIDDMIDDMEEDERLAVQRRAEALGWLDDYDEEDDSPDRNRKSA